MTDSNDIKGIDAYEAMKLAAYNFRSGNWQMYPEQKWWKGVSGLHAAQEYNVTGLQMQAQIDSIKVMDKDGKVNQLKTAEQKLKSLIAYNECPIKKTKDGKEIFRAKKRRIDISYFINTSETWTMEERNKGYRTD